MRFFSPKFSPSVCCSYILNHTCSPHMHVLTSHWEQSALKTSKQQNYDTTVNLTIEVNLYYAVVLNIKTCIYLLFDAIFLTDVTTICWVIYVMLKYAYQNNPSQDRIRSVRWSTLNVLTPLNVNSFVYSV